MFISMKTYKRFMIKAKIDLIKNINKQYIKNNQEIDLR